MSAPAAPASRAFRFQTAPATWSSIPRDSSCKCGIVLPLQLRSSVAAALALVFATAASVRVRAITLLGAALVGVQVLLGLLNVALRLPTDLREAHAINAALLFLAFFTATVLSLLDVTPRLAMRSVAAEPPAP